MVDTWILLDFSHEPFWLSISASTSMPMYSCFGVNSTQLDPQHEPMPNNGNPQQGGGYPLRVREACVGAPSPFARRFLLPFQSRKSHGHSSRQEGLVQAESLLSAGVSCLFPCLEEPNVLPMPQFPLETRRPGMHRSDILAMRPWHPLQRVSVRPRLCHCVSTLISAIPQRDCAQSVRAGRSRTRASD